jgi:hypothetical protein
LSTQAAYTTAHSTQKKALKFNGSETEPPAVKREADEDWDTLCGAVGKDARLAPLAAAVSIEDRRVMGRPVLLFAKETRSGLLD